jgi:endonuclease/exonuclease/phosphatase family metal-dependent hydrolase
MKGSPWIIMGDFNARHKNWDSKGNSITGQMLLDWSIDLNLNILNRKNATTCRRVQGESVVDITMVNSLAARLVLDWKLEEEYPIFSDHRVISLRTKERKRNVYIRESTTAFHIGILRK